MIIQRKTGRPVQFEITADARTSLATWLLRRGGTIDDFVFPSRIHSGQPMSTRQYARLVDEWVTVVGLRRKDYGTHSMRRTKAAMIYPTTGNLRAADPARPFQDREHGPVSWGRRRGCSGPSGAH